MSYKASSALAEAMLDAVKSSLDGGFIFIFSGAVPTQAADALNIAAVHTQVAKLSVSGGATGLTFEVADGAVVSKETTEVWSGLVLFDGFENAATTLTPTFFRFCPAGDTGRGAGSGARLQGTVGGPGSTADMKLAGPTVTDNGSNTVGADLFNVRLSSLL